MMRGTVIFVLCLLLGEALSEEPQCPLWRDVPTVFEESHAPENTAALGDKNSRRAGNFFPDGFYQMTESFDETREKCMPPRADRIPYEPRYKIGTEASTLQIIRHIVREDLVPALNNVVLPGLMSAGQNFLLKLERMKEQAILNRRAQECERLKEQKGTVYGDTGLAHFQCDL